LRAYAPNAAEHKNDAQGSPGSDWGVAVTRRRSDNRPVQRKSSLDVA